MEKEIFKPDDFNPHPVYGDNVTTMRCILCDRNMGMVAMGDAVDGKVPEPEEGVIVTPLPCDACKQKYLISGVMIIEAYHDSRKPTGTVMLMHEDDFKHNFPEINFELLERQHRIMVMCEHTVQSIKKEAMKTGHIEIRDESKTRKNDRYGKTHIQAS